MADGCAIFYLQERLECISVKVLRYGSKDPELMTQVAQIGMFKLKVARDMVQRTRFIVANTHLFWNPKASYIKTLQMDMLLREIDLVRAEDPDAAIVLCGDLNEMPNSATYKLIATGEAEVT